MKKYKICMVTYNEENKYDVYTINVLFKKFLSSAHLITEVTMKFIQLMNGEEIHEFKIDGILMAYNSNRDSGEILEAFTTWSKDHDLLSGGSIYSVPDNTYMEPVNINVQDTKELKELLRWINKT